jgi:low temperature requirement protein LtrA
MSPGEIVLIVGALIVLIIPQVFLKRVRQPLNTYIKWISGLLLLILVWFFDPENSLRMKLAMTAFVIAIAIMNIKKYKESNRTAETKNG